MGRPVMMTLENKDLKGFTWAIAPALTSLGYLLILLVSIFPFWVRLVNEESHEVFFSGLFENCFHIKCWKPRPLSGAICLFQETAYLSCHWLPSSRRSIEETQGVPHLENLESLGGDLSSIQKETLLKEETVI